MTGPTKKLVCSIDGMTCASCVKTVENEIKAQPGISDASVNLLGKKAIIEFDGSKIDSDAIIEAIEDVGFGAEALSLRDASPVRRRRSGRSGSIDSTGSDKGSRPSAAKIGSPEYLLMQGGNAPKGVAVEDIRLNENPLMEAKHPVWQAGGEYDGPTFDAMFDSIIPDAAPVRRLSSGGSGGVLAQTPNPKLRELSTQAPDSAVSMYETPVMKSEPCPTCLCPWCTCDPGSCKCERHDHFRIEGGKKAAGAADMPLSGCVCICCAHVSLLTVKVEGMTCASCVKTVENHLKKIKGVRDGSVNLLGKKAQVQFMPSRVQPEEIVEAIDDIGFEGEAINTTILSGQKSCAGGAQASSSSGGQPAARGSCCSTTTDVGSKDGLLANDKLSKTPGNKSAADTVGSLWSERTFTGATLLATVSVKYVDPELTALIQRRKIRLTDAKFEDKFEV